jgi:hypothetical protein
MEDNKHLIIPATKYTPEINLDAQKGVISLSGKSYPENTFEFYAPFLAWVENYFKNPQEVTTINMEIIYFNSSSSKLFFDFFDLIEEHNSATEVVVNWIYDEENESALEAGEDFAEDFETLNFQLVSK